MYYYAVIKCSIMYVKIIKNISALSLFQFSGLPNTITILDLNPWCKGSTANTHTHETRI